MLKTVQRVHQYRRLLVGTAGAEFAVAQVTEPAYIEAAQRLHARVYLDAGYIDPGMVGPDGRLAPEHDVHRAHSAYFVVHRAGGDGAERSLEVLATARQIGYRATKGFGSFPGTVHTRLYPEAWAQLDEVGPAACVEISALVKRRGVSPLATLSLYRAMWHHSLAARHRYWIMAVDARLYVRLRSLFGDALIEAGPAVHYMGSKVIPALLDVPQSMVLLRAGRLHRSIFRAGLNRRLASFFLEGLK